MTLVPSLSVLSVKSVVTTRIRRSTTARQIERNLTTDCTDDADKGLLRMTVFRMKARTLNAEL